MHAIQTKEQLGAIVGPPHVFDDAASRSSFGRDQSFVLPLEPWVVVRPQTPEQVQQIVIWANETRTPLVPVSSGPPRFNGDTVPGVAGTVILDLSGLAAIKRIDRRNKIAVVEPGVTYAQLDPALAAQGLRIARPLLPRANKSVVASLLERQPTTIPRLNFSLPEPLRVCGVVWGNGQYAFTGEAGMGPLSLEAQWEAGLAQINQQGPLATDLMRLLTGAQGSMGIVVWASIKCELLPAVRRHLSVSAPKLEQLVDFCYRLERLRIGDEIMVLNRPQLEAVLRAHGSPPPTVDGWTVLIGLSGSAHYPQEKVDVQHHEVQAEARASGLVVREGVPGVSHDAIETAFTSVSPTPHWKLARKGGCQDIFFLTTLDKAPGFVEVVEAVARRHSYPVADIGVYIQPQHHGVSQHVEFSLPFDPSVPKEVATVKTLFETATEALVAGQAYFSRPYGLWADHVYRRDATASRVLTIVKDIVDPNRVLNPGKLCF